MTTRMQQARAVPRTAAGRALSAETGSMLIEVIVTAALLLIVAMGLLQAFDNADKRGREQKVKSLAASLAQSEQDRLRARPLDELSNLAESHAATADGIGFTVASSATWVTDSTGVANCATGGADADYLKLRTTVSSPALGSRTPVTVESILTPPARSFNASQGSLAVRIVDRNGAGVAGVGLLLAGPANFSGTTNAQGCFLWGYLTSSSAYELTFSRPGWVEPDGSSGVTTTQSVVGEQTRHVERQYDQAGRLEVDFVTKRHDGGADIPTAPAHAVAQHGGPPAVVRTVAVTGSHMVSQPLFPFASPYAVYADSCPAARPPAPAFIQALPGQTVGPATPIALPSLDFKVSSSGAPVASATVRVTSPCGTTFVRQTQADGRLADPGFPFGSGFSLCVTNGVRRWTQTGVTNATLPGQPIDVDLSASPSINGTCP